MYPSETTKKDQDHNSTMCEILPEPWLQFKARDLYAVLQQQKE